MESEYNRDDDPVKVNILKASHESVEECVGCYSR
jgi:hypothetical protein